MKKKNVTKLNLQKRAISRLDNPRGGLAAGNASPNPVPVGTNVWSNCEVCNTVRKTQCKGGDCPNFTRTCNAVSVPV
ncbi:hypothetical protein [Kordia sp.]|uniref:hypothetical protein n=1 Tax=Kordia sp. TaxID=1965332 RepID=UPI0025C1541D|nr:hypothetical protein [Kordia sp.]MCH2193549.1 hypothetical protein [Kordia sp.]